MTYWPLYPRMEAPQNSVYGFSGYFMACANGHTVIIKILREEEHRTDSDIIAEYVRPLSDLNPNNTT